MEGATFIIAALSQNIPNVGLAYSKKFRGVFESVGIGQQVVDMRRMGHTEILVVIDDAFAKREDIAKHLRKKVPQAKNLVLDIFKDV